MPCQSFALAQRSSYVPKRSFGMQLHTKQLRAKTEFLHQLCQAELRFCITKFLHQLCQAELRFCNARTTRVCICFDTTLFQRVTGTLLRQNRVLARHKKLLYFNTLYLLDISFTSHQNNENKICLIFYRLNLTKRTFFTIILIIINKQSNK